MNAPGRRLWGNVVLARMLGRSRETIRRVIGDYRIEPSGRQSGHDAYSLVAISQALFSVPDDGEMSPLERLNFYRSELARIALAEKCGELIPVEDYDREYSRMIKIMAAGLECLPDKLEMDAGLTGTQMEPVIRTIDGLRENLFQALTDRGAG